MKFTYKKNIFHIKGITQDDYIYKIIANSLCFYEIDLLEYMSFATKNCRKNDSIGVDVRANIGNHSIFLGSFLSDYIIAVEPNQVVLPILKDNLYNNIENYSLYECALGEVANGLGKIMMPTEAGNNYGMAKIETCVVSHENNNKDHVKITTLDSIINQQHFTSTMSVGFVKIDVEGMELEVLKGAKKTLETYQPHLFVECATKKHMEKVDKYLNNYGYKCITYLAATPVYHFAYKPSLVQIYLLRGYRNIIKIKTKIKNLFLLLG